jgi:hypothetical protein
MDIISWIEDHVTPIRFASVITSIFALVHYVTLTA